jgi:hypothetical protein
VSASLVHTVPETLADREINEELLAYLPDGTPQLRTPIRVDGDLLPLSAAPPQFGGDDAAVRSAISDGEREPA